MDSKFDTKAVFKTVNDDEKSGLLNGSQEVVILTTHKDISQPKINVENSMDEDDLFATREYERKRSRSGHVDGFLRQLRSASLSVSAFEKPSPDRNASAILAGWNVSNLIQGTGILGIPFAVERGGWAAMASIFLIAVLGCYTGKILISCLYEQSKKTSRKFRVRDSYPEIAQASFHSVGYTVVSVSQNVQIVGAVVMYIVILGTVFSDLLESVTGLSHLEWSAISCCAALPLIFINRMSVISWLSMIGVFSLFGCIIVLIVFAISKGTTWSISNIPGFDITKFPVGFGIVVFSFCAHEIFPSIEASMKQPEHYNRMLDWSFLFAAVIKAALGLFIVLAFGKDTNEVATVNLKESPVFSTLASIFVVTNIILAIPLAMFVICLAFDDAFLKHFPYLNIDTPLHWVWLVITRPCLMCFILFIAVVVPHFGLLMGFIGSFTGIGLSFIFPCVFYMKMRWDKISRLEVTFQIFIIVVASVAGILGIFFSGKALVNTFGNIGA